MTVRKWLTVAAVAAGLGLGTALPASAADTKGQFTFGSLRTLSPDAAKAKAEAWLKKAGKFDQAAFDKIWAQDEVSVLDRTLATLEFGSPEAKTVLAAGTNSAVEDNDRMGQYMSSDSTESHSAPERLNLRFLHVFPTVESGRGREIATAPDPRYRP